MELALFGAAKGICKEGLMQRRTAAKVALNPRRQRSRGERENGRGKERKEEGDGRSNFECLTCAPNGPLRVLSTFPFRSHFLGHDSVILQLSSMLKSVF